MTDKLEELKRQQAEIEQQIKLEQLKKEQESIQKEIEIIAKTTPSHQDKHAVDTAISRQETYKGKLINLENNQYHVSGVIQRFKTIDETKNYIDSQNNYAAYSPQNYQPQKSHKKWMFALIISVVIIGFLSYKDRNENTKKSSPPQSVKSVEGTTWRGTEENDMPRQYTFLPNGILRLTWSGVSGNNLQNNDNGTWSQNGNEIYFQFNNKHVQNKGNINGEQMNGEVIYATGSKAIFQLNKIDPSKEISFLEYQKRMQIRSETTRRELLKNKCLQVNTVASDSREVVANALQISINSVNFIRTQLNSRGTCLIVVDTPKGQEICKVENIVHDKKSTEYVAYLRNPISGSASCGNWLGY